MKNVRDAPARPALGSSLYALFVREMRAGRRVGGGTSLGVVFFLILVTLSAFAVGPDLPLLGKIAPAILWISGLLATLLGLDRLFQADHEDGSLDLLLTSGTPLELIVLVKCLAHWILTGLPLAAAAPILMGADIADNVRPTPFTALADVETHKNSPKLTCENQPLARH
jgi:heme exporter protein B